MTPAQTKLVLDNLAITSKVARRYSSGQMSGHHDDLLGVAELSLCMFAIKYQGNGDFAAFAYRQCQCDVLSYLRSRGSGKLRGHWPTSLDAMEPDIADGIVHWSLKTFATSSLYKGVDQVGEGKGAANRSKTHCAKGHEFTEQNTIRRDTAQGTRRDCRECRKKRKNVIRKQG